MPKCMHRQWACSTKSRAAGSLALKIMGCLAVSGSGECRKRPLASRVLSSMKGENANRTCLLSIFFPCCSRLMVSGRKIFEKFQK